MSNELQEQVAAWAAMPENREAADLLRAQGASAERERLAPDGRELIEKARSEGFSAGAAAERDRATAVRGLAVPGFEALIETLAGDGVTTPQEAAMAVCAAMRDQHQAAALANHSGAPAPLSYAPAPSAEGERAGSPIPRRIASPEDDQRIADAAAAYCSKNPGVSFVEALHIVTGG